MFSFSVVTVLALLMYGGDVVNTARILAVVPTPSYSHQVPFHPLWKALAKRGHDITLLTTDPMELGDIKNIRQIDLSSAYDIIHQSDFNSLASSGSVNLFEVVPKVLDMFSRVVEAELSHPDVDSLINNTEEHFDLAIVEVFFLAGVAFVARFKCPLIGIHSNDAFGFVHSVLGNPTHPVMYPDATIPYEKDSSLMTRLKSTLVMMGISYFTHYIVLPKQYEIVRKHFGGELPPVDETLRNISMLFIAGDTFLQNVRPVGPNTIYIGGTTHIQKTKPLPQDLQEFLDNAKNGAIYFSLGSNVKSKDISEEKRKLIMEVFSKLPYKVLWKYEADQLDNKPDNVKIIKWAPQHDVLNHTNVKLFITQGGLQSLQEAVFFHVPVLIVPFLGDQMSNAKRAVEQGLGLTLNLMSVTQETFKDTILEIMNNDKYRKNIKQFSEIIQDQPMDGLEKAVWWTEYVIRHKGAEHLKNPTADTPFYQYYLLDVIAVFSLLIIVLLYITQRIVRFVLRSLLVMISGKKKKEEKKRKIKRN